MKRKPARHQQRETATRRHGALEGVRVLDLGQIWAGPLCANLLSDMGAEVVRVETGSRARMGARLEFGPDEPVEHAASYYLRNRTCLSADLSRPEGVGLVRELVGISDVLIENFSPRTLRKWGLDYDSLYALNPTLVVLSLPASGQTGPWSDKLTQGPTLAALYGRASLLGYSGEDWPRADTAESDPLAASFGIIAIMTALFHRQQTGEGQHIDLAQGETLLTVDAEAVLEYTMNHRVMGFRGNRSLTMAPHGIYPCKGDDQWVAISVETEEQWQALRRTMGDPEWTKEDKFQDAHGRIKAASDLDVLLSQWTQQFEAWQATERLQASGVPAYPVLNARGQLDDPHLQYRRAEAVVAEIPMDVGEMTFTNPWKLNKTPAAIRRPTAPIGADNRLVLEDLLGKTPEEVATLGENDVLV